MPQNRPFIVMNVAISVDGKISTVRRDTLQFSSASDRDMMDEIRAQADAVLVGARTIRAEDPPPVRIRKRKRREARTDAGKPPHPLSIVLSRSLNLPLKGRYFSDRQVARLVVTPMNASGEAADRVLPFAEVCRIGQDSVDLRALCEYLKRRGVERLLVEGGGDVNMAFFRENLMDEIYITVCPVIIGGVDAPTPVDGAGFHADELPKLELIDHRRTGDELFLHYRVAHHERNSAH